MTNYSGNLFDMDLIVGQNEINLMDYTKDKYNGGDNDGQLPDLINHCSCSTEGKETTEGVTVDYHNWQIVIVVVLIYIISYLTKRTFKEFQQVVMGLKPEHTEILKKKEADPAVQVFLGRGKAAALLDKYVKKIQELDTEIEKLKIINEIQNLTTKAQLDFTSPTTENAPSVQTSQVPPPNQMGPLPPQIHHFTHCLKNLVYGISYGTLIATESLMFADIFGIEELGTSYGIVGGLKAIMILIMSFALQSPTSSYIYTLSSSFSTSPTPPKGNDTIICNDCDPFDLFANTDPDEALLHRQYLLGLTAIPGILCAITWFVEMLWVYLHSEKSQSKTEINSSP